MQELQARAAHTKYAFFNHTLNDVEMVLANGDVVTCSEKRSLAYRFSMYLNFACNWCSLMAKSLRVRAMGSFKTNVVL